MGFLNQGTVVKNPRFVTGDGTLSVPYRFYCRRSRMPGRLRGTSWRFSRNTATLQRMCGHLHQRLEAIKASRSMATRQTNFRIAAAIR